MVIILSVVHNAGKVCTWLCSLMKNEASHIDVTSKGFEPINADSGQKQPHNYNDNLQAKAKSGKYLIKKCQSEHNQQLSFKYFVESCLILKLLPKVSLIQTTISRGALKH